MTKCCHSNARSPAETLVWLEQIQNSKILMKLGFRSYWRLGVVRVDDRAPHALTNAYLEARYDG